MQEEADAGDTHGATAAKLWSDKITQAMDKLEYDDYGEAILKLLGLDNVNPYYPEESAQVPETKPEPAKTSTSIYSNKAWDVNSPTYNGGRRLGAAGFTANKTTARLVLERHIFSSSLL